MLGATGKRADRESRGARLVCFAVGCEKIGGILAESFDKGFSVAGIGCSAAGTVFHEHFVFSIQ